MILKNPTFGNSYSIDNRAVVKTLMSGESQVITDPAWPKPERLKMQFRGLTEEQKEAFIAFAQAVAGDITPMTDHEGVNWNGLIVDDPEITSEGLNCMWTVSYTYEGFKS